MFRRYLLTGLMAGFLSISSTLYAGESEIILKDNTTEYGLTIKEAATNSTIASFRGSGLSYFVGGNVGIGTAEPEQPLVVQTDAQDKGVTIYNSSQKSDNDSSPLFLSNRAISGTINTVVIDNILGRMDFRTGSTGGLGTFGDVRMSIDTSGNVGIGTRSPSEKLEVSGNIKAAGTVSQGSSKEFKKNISYVSTKDAMNALNKLNPVRFEYKTDNSGEKHLGFIAEDVPDLVAEQDRKHLNSMDITAVLTKVVQEQQRMLQDQKETIDAMKQEIETLKTGMNYGVKGL